MTYFVYFSIVILCSTKTSLDTLLFGEPAGNLLIDVTIDLPTIAIHLASCSIGQGRVTRTRVAQILNLLKLPGDVIEKLWLWGIQWPNRWLLNAASDN